MKLPVTAGMSIALITLNINITVPPRVALAPNRVTQSLRDAVTRSRGVLRRCGYKAQHLALSLKEKIRA